jgi:hypothetical protein
MLPLFFVYFLIICIHKHIPSMLSSTAHAELHSSLVVLLIAVGGSRGPPLEC